MGNPGSLSDLSGNRLRSLPALLALFVLMSGGCSMNQLVVRSSMGLMEESIRAMHRETDLELARAAMPANLKMLEGMIEADPGNARLRVHAAEGYYGYSFAFVEPDDPERAAGLYARCRDYGAAALARTGFDHDLTGTPLRELEQALQQTDSGQVPALFWTASCWAKHIDLNRDDPRSIARLGRAAALMQRVLELDPDYYHGGPHLFFGVYYGSRPPMLGGDPERSREHFEAARASSDDRLLLANVLQAEFLDRQLMDRDAFHERLTGVLDTAVADGPSQLAFINQVARERARWLLTHEDEWF
ncbi:TRAP transporter TatT component family protein [Thiohalobacter thiocyanaticus]|nr:TRAP transporter TatT component family protein [Thiohalobacter thiocyanaticus]